MTKLTIAGTRSPTHGRMARLSWLSVLEGIVNLLIKDEQTRPGTVINATQLNPIMHSNERYYSKKRSRQQKTIFQQLHTHTAYYINDS